MVRMEIPPPSSGGLLLSYKCTAACRHCMYACSQEWETDWIPEETLERGLAQLAGRIKPSPWGARAISLNHGLHFTGGEPFLNFDLLLRAVRIAGELDIPSTFVETNCFWCIDDERTRNKLTLLKYAGLCGILISVNPFYAEYVPFERTDRCIRISQQVFGRNVAVYQIEYYKRFKKLGIKDPISLDDYMALTRNESLADRVELFLMGRAGRSLRALYPSAPPQAFFSEPCLPPFIRPWHNHFDNYGNFMPGYCGGISLGSWTDLDRLVEEGIDLDENPVLGFLVTGDMQGLFHFAKEYGFAESGEGYLSKCDLCLDIRKHLVSKGEFRELEPRAFYTHADSSSWKR